MTKKLNSTATIQQVINKVNELIDKENSRNYHGASAGKDNPFKPVPENSAWNYYDSDDPFKPIKY